MRLIHALGLASGLALLLSSGVVAQSQPQPPTGVGFEDSALVAADILAYADTGASNQRGDACLATVDTNAGVRLLSGFLDVWTPRSAFVDADVEAEAKGDCAAVVKSDWDGVPGSATDGAVVDAEVHAHNIGYVIAVTAARSPSQGVLAYLDDRRGKNVSLIDGLGPLADAWRAGAHQSTTVTYVPADATSVKYDDMGNNRGVPSAGDEAADIEANTELGLAVDLFHAGSADGSTEPAKRYYKYARPWRWSGLVDVLPALEPAKSGSPGKDGGFPSGHTAEAWRDGLVLAYLVPQRFQEVLTRSVEMGDSRILAGMHSPLDVIGGRMLGTAVVVYNFNRPENAELKAGAYAQAQSWLMRQTGATDATTLFAASHAAPIASDRFADPSSNVAYAAARMSYGFDPIGATDAPAVVPKGAEVLLETRLPYLSAEQRRVVLKTTALPAGYPVMSDAEGYGRLDYIRAADGYAAFDGDVTVTMDAALGGFHAADSWRNDISGAGMLRKAGSGALTLSGDNSFAGGTLVEGGKLKAASRTALGTGAVYLVEGELALDAAGLEVGSDLTVRSDANLTVMAGGETAPLAVAGTAYLDGTLSVTAPTGVAPGATIAVIEAEAISGQFANVTLDGVSVEAGYEDGVVSVIAP